MKILPNNSSLIYSGRIDWSDPSVAVWTYPATFVRIRFKGSHLSVRVKNKNNYWDNYLGVVEQDTQTKLLLPKDGEADIAEAKKELADGKTEADKKNWNACHTALNTYSDEEREVFVALYSDTAPLPEAIAKIAKEHRMEQNRVWNMVNDLEKKVAKRRGLI